MQIDVSGGSESYGIHRNGQFGLSPVSLLVSGSTVKAPGGIQFIAFVNQLKVEHSTIHATATGGYGIQANAEVIIDHSEITGDESVVEAFTASIGATRLNGGPVFASTATCAGVYDESFTFYSSTCP